MVVVGLLVETAEASGFLESGKQSVGDSPTTVSSPFKSIDAARANGTVLLHLHVHRVLQLNYGKGGIR